MTGDRAVLVEQSFEVPLALADAWAALADVESWPTWAPHIRSAVLTPPGPVGPTTAGVFRFSPMGRSRFAMTSFDPPRSWTGRAMGVDIDYDHRFEPVSDTSTRLVWVVRSRSGRVGLRARLFALVYSRLIDRAWPRFAASVSRSA